MRQVKIGATGRASLVVSQSQTANSVGSGELDVLATPIMIALMEKAASLAIQEFLEEGETSVGTQISTSHELASHIGAEVEAFACVVSTDRRREDFEIEARQCEQLLGKGLHSRFVVNAEKFMSKE